MAITLDQIDQALFDLLVCEYLPNAAEGTVEIVSNRITVNGTPCQVFLGAPPKTENDQDAKYPAIVILQQYLQLDYSRMETESNSIIVSEDLTANPPIRTVKKDPEPYRIKYEIHLFARTPLDDRELVSKTIGVFVQFGTLLIGEEYFDFTRTGALYNLDRIIKDQYTFHKIIEVDLRVEIEADYEEDQILAGEIRIGISPELEGSIVSTIVVDVDGIHVE